MEILRTNSLFYLNMELTEYDNIPNTPTTRYRNVFTYIIENIKHAD